MSSHSSRAVRASVLLVAVSTLACVTPIEQKIPEGEIPRLRAHAAVLRNADMTDLIVPAEATVRDMAFSTMLIRDVASRSKDAVLSLYTKGTAPYRLRLLPIQIPGTGFRIDLPAAALGSGFFIHESGLVLTNNHVIEGAEQILGRMSNGTEVDLEVLARDPTYDVALLRVKSPTDVRFPVLPMGDSTEVQSGDLVIAVGNPLGLGHTVTLGIISQKGRVLPGVDRQKRHAVFLQTDTSINPGSSGGPLITMTGAWVGLNTAGYEGAQGIGFAIPSAKVREFLNAVIAGAGEHEADR